MKNTDRREKIRKLLSTGCSQTEAAARLNLSVGLVNYYANTMSGKKQPNGSGAASLHDRVLDYARPYIMAEVFEKLEKE